jgi:hypothetical protein
MKQSTTQPSARWLLWGVFALLSVPLLMYLSAMPLIRYAYDDFCNMAVYRQIGFVAGVIYWFENLMGRYTLLVLNGGLATLEARDSGWVLLLWVLCFAVVAFSGGTSSLGSPMLVTILNAPLAYAAWVLIAWLLGYCHPVALTLQTRKRLLLWVIGVLVLTAAAIGLPFIPIAYFVGTGLVVHMWILPMFAWLVGSGVVAWLFGRLMAGYRVRVLGVRSRALVVIALVAFWLTALPIAWQARMTQATYAQAWDERHQAIQAVLAGNTVTPASDVLDSPYDKIRRPDAADDPNLRPLVMASLRGVSPFRWEVVADPQNFANQCVAAYYGVAQVVAAADGG